MYVLELPLCHDAVVVNVDELINVESTGRPRPPVGDDVGNGGEMVMLEGSSD